MLIPDQDDEPETLQVAVSFILLDARESERCFELLNHDGGFPRLVQLIQNPRQHEEGAHRLLMELLYEMSRIQKIIGDDLSMLNLLGHLLWHIAMYTR